jgi:hypothetical protein
VIASAVYLFFFVYSATHMGVANLVGHLIGAADARLRSVLMEGAFTWWLVGSWLSLERSTTGAPEAQEQISVSTSIETVCYHRFAHSGGERGPVTFPAFKAGDSALGEPSGEFDSHTLPPTHLF